MERTTRTPGRAGYLLYGTLCYAAFISVILYAIGFVGNFWRTFGWNHAMFRSMDEAPVPTSTSEALLIDGLLLALFAIQHSGMARTGFKRFWTRFVPPPVERSTFVLAASSCLTVLFWQWRPIGTTLLWHFEPGPAATLLIVLSIAGWLLVFAATFMLDHFDLFGLRQVWYAFRGQRYPDPPFSAPALYKAVRHPIYLGFVIAFWATPVMTLGHLLFAAMTTGYILLAIQLEERDLVLRYGEEYRQYRRRVWMLVPMPKAIRASRAA